MQANGNCLFRAACYVLHLNEHDHKLLRHQVATYVQNRGDVLGGLLNYSPDDGCLFAEHVNYLRGVGNAFGDNAIIALANVYYRKVHISS